MMSYSAEVHGGSTPSHDSGLITFRKDVCQNGPVSQTYSQLREASPPEVVRSECTCLFQKSAGVPSQSLTRTQRSTENSVSPGRTSTTSISPSKGSLHVRFAHESL